jgi:hypothetical protein
MSERQAISSLLASPKNSYAELNSKKGKKVKKRLVEKKQTLIKSPSNILSSSSLI